MEHSTTSAPGHAHNKATAEPAVGQLPAKFSFHIPHDHALEIIPLAPRNGSTVTATVPEIHGRLDRAQLRTIVADSHSPMLDVAAQMLDKGLNAQTPQGRERLAALGIDTHHAWCADFANVCAKLAGVRETGSSQARSFANHDWGTQTRQPKSGDVVVFNLGHKRHHVGIFICATPDGRILSLGGNQHHEVCIAAFPAKDVQSFIRPPASDSNPLEIAEDAPRVKVKNKVTADNQKQKPTAPSTTNLVATRVSVKTPGAQV